MPRISASRRFFSQESRDTGPIVRRVVGAVVARAFEADPLFRPAPHIVEAPGVLGRDDLILGGDDTQKPGFHLGRVSGRIETVLQQPVHRQEGVTPLPRLRPNTWTVSAPLKWSYHCSASETRAFSDGEPPLEP